MVNINAFKLNVKKDFEDPYAKFAAERDLHPMTDADFERDTRDAAERDQAFSDWYYEEVAKANRGEFAMVRRIGNVEWLLIPQWSAAKAYRCEVIEFPPVTQVRRPLSDGSAGSDRCL